MPEDRTVGGNSVSADANALPVKAVTLFSSGVSYTLREGEIDGGEAQVRLTFRTSQVSDILKSLVLLDESGTVRAATYPSRDPIGRTLQSFAVNVTDNLTREGLLAQLRGAEVRVETTNGESLTGRVVGVERGQEVTPQGNYIEFQTLNLLGADGLAALRLDRIRLLRLLDPRLDAEFRDALAVLASGSDDNRRQVTLTFAGAGRRTVRVGYVSESPVWKVSYRLVLDDSERPYLQGWAMVENTTEEDWEGVALSLVSGRPVSFIQDLYQPLYVPRPVVPPDVEASPNPQMHGSDLGGESQAANMLSLAAPQAASQEPEEEPDQDVMLAKRAARGEGRHILAIMAAPSMRDSTPTRAKTYEAGELFEYRIAELVDLPRQQAAMLPIVSEDFDGEKLSLYNADVHPRFPMNAFRLRNTTGLSLKAGPITVFDGGVYAGDARIEDIPSGDTRLITYAVDQAVEVARAEEEARVQETLVIKRGILHRTAFRWEETHYTLKSKAKTARTVLIEQEHRVNWNLIQPEQPTERTTDRYRFAVSLSPGETKTLVVREERPEEDETALYDLNEYRLYQTVTSAEESSAPSVLQEALRAVLARRRELDEIRSRENAGERERKKMIEEQDRIRQNLAAIDTNSNLYRRYMAQLEAFEDRLDALRVEAERLSAEWMEKSNALKVYLDDLDIG